MVDSIVTVIALYRREANTYLSLFWQEPLAIWEQVPLFEKSTLMWKLTKEQNLGTVNIWGVGTEHINLHTKKRKKKIVCLTLGTLWVSILRIIKGDICFHWS